MAKTRNNEITDTPDMNLKTSRRKILRDEDDRREDNTPIDPDPPRNSDPQIWDEQPSSEQKRLARSPDAPIRPEADPWDTNHREERAKDDRQLSKQQSSSQNDMGHDKDLDDVRRSTSYERYDRNGGPPTDGRATNKIASPDEKRDQIRRGNRATEKSVSEFEGGGRKHQGRH